jgi:hypothetical protein
MGLTLAAAIVLAAAGADGWSPLAWVGGAGMLACLTVIGKGYWRPNIIRQLVGLVGRAGTFGILLLVIAFNLFLSATFIGVGILLGTIWRIIQ